VKSGGIQTYDTLCTDFGFVARASQAMIRAQSIPPAILAVNWARMIEGSALPNASNGKISESTVVVQTVTQGEVEANQKECDHRHCGGAEPSDRDIRSHKCCDVDECVLHVQVPRSAKARRRHLGRLYVI